MKRHAKWSLWGIAGLMALVALVSFSEEIDWEAWRHSLETMDQGPLLALVCVLPLFGFSIAVVYLVVGAVFGGWGGLAVVAGATAVHLLGSHWIARSFLRAPVLRFFHRRNYRLPEVPPGEEWTVALMTALVPGLPYFARNYLLALSGIPLRIYFWFCWPVYVLRSSIVIFLGDFRDGYSAQRMGVLGVVLVLKVAICAYLLHRLRRRHKARREAATAKPARQHGPLKVKVADST